jgi:hypothetical protein
MNLTNNNTVKKWGRLPHSILSTAELSVRRIGGGLIESYPLTQKPIMHLWAVYILAYVGFCSWVYSFQYARRTTLDPFRVVLVDPDRIEYIVESDGYPSQTREYNKLSPPKFKYAGTVLKGDWDYTDQRFNDTDIYRAFEARFEQNKPWHETNFYRKAIEFIEDNIELWGCSSEREFKRRCDFIEDLYESISKHGHLSQTELSRANLNSPGEQCSPKVLRLVNDEVTVCIGRNGELLFVDGRNRLAIAKLLGLSAIPVWVLARHEKWQQFREYLATDPTRCGQLPGHLQEHPDLRDICNGDAVSK